MLAISDAAIYNISCVMKCAPLAQLVEHLTLNQGVRGSSPRRRIIGLSVMDSPIFLCLKSNRRFGSENDIMCLINLNL